MEDRKAELRKICPTCKERYEHKIIDNSLIIICSCGAIMIPLDLASPQSIQEAHRQKQVSMINVFEERRIKDPQGVIDDLISEISRQATALYEKNARPDLTEQCNILLKVIDGLSEQQAMDSDWYVPIVEEVKKAMKQKPSDTSDGVEPLGQAAMEKKIKPRPKTRAKKTDKTT